MRTYITYPFLGIIYIFLVSSHIGPSPSVDLEKSAYLPNAKNLQQYETAYFASGCFWCVEAIFESVYGVTKVVSGYAGGKTKNPNYQQIGTGRTGHAETVEVYYDPNKVNFKTLLVVFFSSHDPTTKNRQGPDSGSQYRSIAFYKSDEERKLINDYIQTLTEEKTFPNPIVTEIQPFTSFYKAEEYHQDFEKLNPQNPYVKQISIPRLNRFKKSNPDLLKNDK
jgi:peptide-methionine (S)-S-oxide reductase